MKKVLKEIEDYADYSATFFRPGLIEDITNNLKEYIDTLIKNDDNMKEYTGNMPSISLD